VIEPAELVFQDTPGLDPLAVTPAGGLGLHVIIGRNNSGKTRLLRALKHTRLAARVVLKDLPPPTLPTRDDVPGVWRRTGELRLIWPRNLPSVAERVTERVRGRIPAGIEIDSASTDQLIFREQPIGQAVWRAILSELSPELGAREAAEVPTNRHFPPNGNLTAGGDINEVAQWPSLLGNMAYSDVVLEAEQFRRIADAFSLISEGLGLECRGRDGRTTVYVRDGDNLRAVDSCGDGLRDVVGILLYAVRMPDHDLLIDEPGLRLHPHAQRRLLEFLESEARKRAIWIATHDGVFIGDTRIATRFYVCRDAAADKASVVALPDRVRTQQALDELGWLPADAFLADKVLLCEGSSDKTAFEAVLRWLEWGDGAVVSQLGGSGVVWGHNESGLLNRLRLVREIAPHAAIAVLLDSDGQAKERTDKKCEVIRKQGFTIGLLRLPELENYWLEAKVVRHVLSGLADQASAKHGKQVPVPTLEDVERVLTEKAKKDAKGSNVLEEVADAFSLRFDKDAAALLAVAKLREFASGLAEELKEAVKACFPVAAK
jgi:hypothetical protein